MKRRRHDGTADDAWTNRNEMNLLGRGAQKATVATRLPNSAHERAEGAPKPRNMDEIDDDELDAELEGLDEADLVEDLQGRPRRGI